MISRLATVPLVAALLPAAPHMDRRWLGVALFALLLAGFVVLIFYTTRDTRKK